MERLAAVLLSLCLLAGCTARGSLPQSSQIPSAAVQSESEAADVSETERSGKREANGNAPATPARPALLEPSGPSGKEEASQSAQDLQPTGDSPDESVRVEDISHALAGRISGNSWRDDGPVTLEELCYVQVRYLDFEGDFQVGELIVHKALAQEVADIFEELYEAGFPIGEVSLVEKYGCDDDASMEAGNTSCFNTRRIAGTDRWSMHSYGAAIDINPIQNPFVTPGGARPSVSEEYLNRDDARSGMIVEGDACHSAFTSRGWTWGGQWENPDYQHFEKAAG